MAKYDAVAIGDILDAVSHGVSRIELEAKTKMFFIISLDELRTITSNSGRRVIS